MTRYEPATQSYTSDFFESWKVEDPNTWVFTMKPGLKRHNGEPVVLEDFVHSIDRIKTDPQSRQANVPGCDIRTRSKLRSIRLPRRHGRAAKAAH
jgi:ABC-type transport system substrate-binding protein